MGPNALSINAAKTLCELILERTDWEPPPEKITADSIVAVKIEGYETDLRKQVKAAGGK